MINHWLVLNFEKRRRQIEAEAALGDLASNAESIRRLRVGIKQVRALFKLVAWLAPKSFNSKAAFSELRPIFKAMGKVRDVQVLEGLLVKYGEQNGEWYAGMGLFLDQTRRRAQSEMPTAIESFAPSNLAKVQSQMEAALKPLEDQRLLKKAQAKLQKRFAKIEQALPAAAANPEILHDVRTWLKEGLYVMEMLNKAVQWEVWPKKMVKDLFWVAREAGEWHDREILWSMLSSLENGKEPFMQGKAYVSLQEGLEGEVQERAAKLLERISGFLERFQTAPFVPVPPKADSDTLRT